MSTNLLKEGEEIKPIKGYTHYYVSNFGNFFTDYPTSRWGKGFRVLRERNHPTNYKYVGLYREDEDGVVRRYWLRSHRVVANHFIGDVKRSTVVDHIDHNKGNNNAINLQITTQKENIIRYHQHKRENNK
jgi:hypothetical protein